MFGKLALISFFLINSCIELQASNKKENGIFEDTQGDDKNNIRKIISPTEREEKKDIQPNVLKNTQSSTNTLLSKYLEASFYGAVRGLAGLPIEHPFDCLKTTSQAHSKALLPVEVLKEIYIKNGIKGFYSGVIPNGTRMAIKQTYRWPMMLAFPSSYDAMLGEDWNKRYPSVSKMLTGGTIASLETFIICPLERLKVWLMTAYRDEKSLTTFFRENKGNLKHELFKGLNASYPRQMTSWISFLVADDKFKSIARQYTGQKELSFTSLMAAGFFVGLTNTAITMPFDCIKTKLQMRAPLENKGLIEILRHTYKNFGMRGIYAGWQPRMLQYMIQSAFTVTILDKLEQKWKK